MEFQPLVSIIIPVYNGSNYLSEAIDSALNQTYTNIEILVINDGSTDNGKTREVALSYGGKIRYFEKANGGVSTALNLGIKEMKGAYFSWLSHDDSYYPEKIEKQIVFLSKHENKNIITYSNFCCINSKSEITYTYNVRKIDPGSFKLEFILGNLIYGCSLLIPKICFDTCGLFNENLIGTQDFELWFKIAEAGYEFYLIPDVLVKWRHHDQQVGLKRKEICDAECNNMYSEFLSRIKKSEIRRFNGDNLIDYYLRYTNVMLNYGYKRPAQHAFWRAVLTFDIISFKRAKLLLSTGKRLFFN